MTNKRKPSLDRESFPRCISGGDVEEMRKELERLCTDEIQAVLTFRGRAKGSGERKEKIVCRLAQALLERPLDENDLEEIQKQRKERSSQPQGRTAKERAEETIDLLNKTFNNFNHRNFTWRRCRMLSMFRYALANCRVLYDVTHKVQTEQRRFYEDALKEIHQHQKERRRKECQNARQRRKRARQE